MLRPRSFLAGLGLALGAVACNALFGDTSQCATDADCTHFGEGAICAVEGSCRRPEKTLSTNVDASSAGDGASPTRDASAPAPEVATIVITPATASVPRGQTQFFSAVAMDAKGKTIVPAPAFTWTTTGGGTIEGTGLFRAGDVAGGPFTITAKSGIVSATATASVTAAATKTVTMGETNILALDDSGNGNFLLAQEATLAEAATIRKLHFYVAQAAGKLRLGIYDATGPANGPGAKKAETAEFDPAVGWQAVDVLAPVALPAGKYWLAYAPSSSDLHFNRDGNAGSIAYYPLEYGAMPATFSETPTTATDHWSFYATLSAP
jgi:hypothetical protein